MTVSHSWHQVSPQQRPPYVTSVYKKPTLTDWYLDWNLNHPTSAKRSVVCALFYITKNVCTISDTPDKEMDFSHQVSKKRLPRMDHQRNRKETSYPIINSEASLEVKKISDPYVCGLSEDYRRTFHNLSTLQTEYNLQMILSQRKLWSILICDSSRCLENRVKEHSSHVTIAIYIHSDSNIHPLPTFLTWK